MISQRSQSAMVSLAVHTGIIALLLIASSQIIPRPKRHSVSSTTPLFAPRLTATGHSRRGGGIRQIAPASHGQPPKSAPRQFVPPVIEAVNYQPKLAMTPTIEAPPTLDRPAQEIGDPLSKFTGRSAGQGGPLGIGDKGRYGIGNLDGPGVGDGLPGITVYKPGRGITMPVVISHVDPEFSDEARKSKHAGMVRVQIIVDATGQPRNIHVVQTLGMGLDERAVEAVSKWRFKPGTKDGKPVAVSAMVEVMFHLL